ncbi:MAG: hypothetical protein WD049_10350 [Candidatus Paceibacterota bacterium]
MSARFSLTVVSLASLAFFCGGTLLVQAQASDLVLRARPAHIAVGKSATIEIVTYDLDIPSARVTWSVNGEERLSEIGHSRFTLTPREPGRYRVRASVATPSGIFQATTDVTAGYLDLVAQARGYTPPLYRGRALLAPRVGGSIVAVPHLTDAQGRPYRASELMYQWSRGGSRLSSASGIGRQTLSIPATDSSRDKSVSVTVTSPDGYAGASNSLTLSRSAPQVLLYHMNPLYGIEWHNALIGAESLSTRETGLVAVPYFFGVTEPTSSSLRYVWQVNGQVVADASGRHTLQVGTPENEAAGRADVSVSAVYTALFQNARAETQLELSEDTSGGIVF